MSEETVVVGVDKPAPKARTRKPAASKAKAEVKAKFGYLQNKEGRVFVATPYLIKQMKKSKFGLMKINKATYDEALKNGGLTDPVEDFEDEDE